MIRHYTDEELLSLYDELQERLEDQINLGDSVMLDCVRSEILGRMKGTR